MPKFTQKYTIIQLLEPIEDGAEWAVPDWPLHVTIADIFAIDLEGSHLLEKLTELLSSQRPFMTTAAHDEYFGGEKQTLVTTLDMNDELIALHNSVVTLLKSFGADFNDPQHIEDGFRAHATARSNTRLHEGDNVAFDALTIVDMFPDDDPFRRKILKTIKLGETG